MLGILKISILPLEKTNITYYTQCYITSHNLVQNMLYITTLLQYMPI